MPQRFTLAVQLLQSLALASFELAGVAGCRGW